MKQAFTNTTNKKTSGKPLHLKSRGNVRMPICRYGAACMYKSSCIYRHPRALESTQKSSKICMAFIAGHCTFGDKCFNLHPDEEEIANYKEKLLTVMCKHGGNCETSGCLYKHPEPLKSVLNVHASDFIPKHIKEIVIPENVPTYSLKSSASTSNQGQQYAPRRIKIPVELWVNDYERPENAYFVKGSMDKFAVVNQIYSTDKFKKLLQQMKVRVIDLHYQTVKGCLEVLGTVLPKLQMLKDNQSVSGLWIITGTGHHVASNSHQRTGKGGESILFSTTKEYLLSRSVPFSVGVDHGGNNGALYVSIN